MLSQVSNILTPTNNLTTPAFLKMAVTTKATIASFGGRLLKLSHNARSTACEMAFNLYLPPQAITSPTRKVPLLIYLSGLTCTPDNGSEKGFFQHKASEKGIALLFPDTSPRGLGIPGEDDSYDFGSAAGFYVDATKEPWSKGYKMYSYITEELPKTVFEAFKEVDSDKVSIFGHSMGGHGALTLVSLASKYKRVDVLTINSSSRIRANTRASPLLPQSPILPNVRGAKRRSRATSVRTTSPSGPSMMRLSL